jgi:hypothetical protein
MTRLWGFGIIAGAFFSLIFIWTLKVDQTLGPSNFISGCAVFGVLVALALFNGRKQLPFLPLCSASWWFLFHISVGFLAVGLFWLHTDIAWPKSLYNQILAFLFYSVSITGIIGLIIEKIYPKSLTQAGVEYIYERIPARIAEIRAEAESLIEKCTQTTGSDTLARHYLDDKSLHWFFVRPRFFFNHIFLGRAAQHWVEHQCSLLERYLDETEQTYLDKIETLADTKRKMDFHYSVQRVLKGWLMVHVPLATALVVSALWHLIVVQVYL